MLLSLSCTHAAVNTPAEPIGARVARFPIAASLPRNNGGSASALPVSRPARRSLALRPACSLNRPRRPFFIGVLQPNSLPPCTAPTASGWSDSCRAGFSPAEIQRLSTAHVIKRAAAAEPCLYVVHHYGRRRKIERNVVRERPTRIDGNGFSISFRYQFLIADGHESRILLFRTLTVKPIPEYPRHVFSMGDTKYPSFLRTQFQRHRTSISPRRFP